VFAYIVRRLLATIPVMGVVALFVFSLLYLIFAALPDARRPGGDHRR
jgi:hypothetical protein